MDKTLFNALCDVAIYHFCDVCHKAGNENSASAKLLVELGIMEDTEDGQAAYDKYEEMVVEYALDAFGGDYHRGHDYWGAVCIMRNGQSTKSSLPFAGDSCGKIMLFADYDSLVAYTKEYSEDE